MTENSIDWTGVVVVLAVAAAVAFTGVQVMDVAADEFPTQEELDTTGQHFEDYCSAEHGDDVDVYLANGAGMAEHNGYHCDYGDGVVHLNQVPPDVWDAYVAGEIPASEVTASLEPAPGVLSWQTLVPLLVVVPVIGVVYRFRDDSE